MRLGKLLVPILLVSSSFAIAQNLKNSSQNTANYIKIDLSNSLAGNETHDRLYYLMLASEAVMLPTEVTQALDGIQDTESHVKLNGQRAGILKVLYNDRISPDDKKFLSQHYLNSTKAVIAPIKHFFQEYLNN